MKCSDIEDLLELYLAQKLDLKQRVAVESHLLSCTACASKLADLSLVQEMFNELEEEELPPGLHEKIMREIELTRAETSQTAVPAKAIKLHQERALLYGDSVSHKSGRAVPLWTRMAAVAAAVVLVTVTGLQLIDRVFNKHYPEAGALMMEDQASASLSVSSLPSDSYGRFAVGITPEVHSSRFYDLLNSEDAEAKQIQQFSISGVSSFLPQSEEVEPEEESATAFENEAHIQLESISLYDSAASSTSSGSLVEGYSEVSPTAVVLMAPLINADTGTIDLREQDDPGGEAKKTQEALLFAEDTEASLPVLPASGMSKSTGETEATVLFAAPSTMSRQASHVDEPEIETETLPSVVGTETSYALSGRLSSETQNRSAEWQLSVKAKDIDPQYAIARAKELGCVNRYVGDSISFYGSNRALHQLVEDLGLYEELIWSEGAEQSLWSADLQSEEDIWLQLVITILK